MYCNIYSLPTRYARIYLLSIQRHLEMASMVNTSGHRPRWPHLVGTPTYHCRDWGTSVHRTLIPSKFARNASVSPNRRMYGTKSKRTWRHCHICVTCRSRAYPSDTNSSSNLWSDWIDGLRSLRDVQNHVKLLIRGGGSTSWLSPRIAEGPKPEQFRE